MAETSERSRIACFVVPLFPLAARLRSEPELRDEAVAILEGNGSAAHVVAASRRARRNGIRSGQSLPQARSILPRLIARGRDHDCERAAQEALLDLADRFSPRVEDAGDGVVYLDLDGVESQFRSRTGDLEDGSWERALALDAIRIAETQALPIRAGIASSKLAARIAAELPDSPHVVPPDEEAGFLAPLPLDRLAPEIGIATTLRKWGIASIGDFARLPEGEVATRLGELGRELYAAARGVDPRPLVPRFVPPSFEEGMELEWPVVALEPFLFVLRSALERIVQRLETTGYSCRRLELTLELEPDGWNARGIDLPAPTRDVKTMLTLLRLDLEQTPPGAPVLRFTLAAHPDRPRRGQLSLFGPQELSPDRLATTLAKLASMVGADRVGAPRVVDSHMPQAYAVVPFDPPPPPKIRKEPRRSRGLLAFRVLRPPVPLEVITEEEGSCLDIRSIRSTAPPPAVQIEGHVKVASGPWRMEEGWWTESPTGREYWDVELWKGGLWRVYRDIHAGDWFADANYD